MKNKIVSLVLMLSSLLIRAQDIHFSQYTFANPILNPALTSSNKDLIATINHKEQWRSVKAYRTSHASFEMKLAQPNWIKQQNHTGYFMKRLQKGLAFGINLFSDNSGGVIKHFQTNLFVAYHARLSETSVFSLGLSGGFAQRSVNVDDLRWNDQYSGGVYDPTIPSGETFKQSISYGDFGAGLLYSYGEGSRYSSANDHKYVTIGASAMHVNKPGYNFGYAQEEQLNIRYNFHINTLFGVSNSTLSFGPTALYMMQGPLKEFIAGGLVKYKLREASVITGFIKSSAFSVGCYYRGKDAIIPQFIYEMNHYSIGVSYDVNISGLTPATTGRGGIEIFLRFNNPNPFLYQNKSRV